MQFNKTTIYALRVLSHMATDESVLHSAQDIHEKVNIPYRYLRKLMTSLSKSGLIVSVQGKSGGYKIVKALKDISLMDIITAVDDKVLSNECFFGYDGCGLKNKCTMHDKWYSIRNKMKELLTKTNLSVFKNEETRNFITNNKHIST